MVDPAQAERGGDDPRPVVRLPAAGVPSLAVAAVALIGALALFVALNGHRRQPPQAPVSEQVNAFPPPPPLNLPPDVPAAPPSAARLPATPRAFSPPAPVRAVPLPYSRPPLRPPEAEPPPAASPGEPAGGAGPALVFDADARGGGQGTSGTLTPGLPPGAPGPAAGEDTPVTTTTIRNRTTIVPVGTLISAVLETPIDSTRPGLARAIVSEDVRGFDGERVLVPKGSRLVGEYGSDIRSGQNRMLVTWTRLVRPDGVAIRISSPSADMLGKAGVPGRVNSFFLQRFAGAVLQSALNVGVNLASRPGRGSVIVGLQGGTTGSIGQDLLPGNDLKPRITVTQGAQITVFVARDLDFSGTPDVTPAAGR